MMLLMLHDFQSEEALLEILQDLQQLIFLHIESDLHMQLDLVDLLPHLWPGVLQTLFPNYFINKLTI